MRDLYLEGLLLGPAYPAGREEFVDLVWSLANGERGFRTAREVYRYDTKKSEYYWYSKREEVAVEIGRPRPVSLRGEKALLLFSPSPFPAGSMIRLEDLRDLKGGFTWLEWEPDAKGGINTIKVGSILFSSPSRELVDQEIGPYVESLRRIFLHLASICRPVHALCGEMRIPGPPALEKARKAVARHTIWAIDWINVFGPPYVEKFGKEFLLGAPGHREEAVEGHLIVYQPTKGFFPWEAAEPSPAAVERYFTSHPDIPWVEYRPWLKQALASGDESPGIRSLARAKDERKGRGLFSRLAGEGKAKVRGKTARWMTVEGLREVAESTARDARRTLGLELDFSPGSLRVLDEAIDRFFRSKEPLVATTVLSFGAYVGEVVIRSLGGRWQPAAAWDDCAVVDIGPIAEMFPMRRVAKRFEEGEEASLAFWYEAAARAAQG